jgi:tyrosine-protein phosphatase SIW14
VSSQGGFRSTVTVLLAVACAGGIWAAQNPAIHVRNFGRVNQYVYRGGEPSLLGLQELGAMGVKIDLDLREPGGSTAFERKQAEKLGMKFINVPLSAFSAPTNAQMKTVLSLLLRDTADPIFIHCLRGKDRTGTVIACYRIQHDGWSNSAALDEARRFGMSFAERRMLSYIAHFKSLPATEILGVGGPLASRRGAPPAQP